MSGFVKINFDAVDDSDDSSSDFFMDDSSGDSFVMADEADESLDSSFEPLFDEDDDDEEEVVPERVFKSLRKFPVSGSGDVDGSVETSVGESDVLGGVRSVPVGSVVNPLLVDDDNDDESLEDDSFVVGSDDVSGSVLEEVVVSPVKDVSSSLSNIVNPLLVDDVDDLDFGDEGLGSDEGVVGSVRFENSSVVNPLLDDDDDEFGDAPFLGFSGGGDSGAVVSSGGEDEGSGVGEGVGSVRDEVRSLADVSSGRETELSIVGDAPERVVGESSVVVEKRGPRFIESDFRRKNVSEVVVGEGEEGSVGAGGEKQRYRYVRDDGRLNGAELEFFKRLGVSRRDTDDERLRLLRGRVDGVDTVAARKARNVLYADAVGGKDLLRRGSKARFSEVDRDVLQFLAKFRYVKDEHLAFAFNRAVSTMYSRLKKLRSQGLVIDKKVYGSRPVWFLTEAGMLLSGMDLPRTTESRMSISMFPHQFTVNHIAANVWGANVNVLNLPDFPAKNRENSKRERIFGESLVSELEIQSALGRVKMFDKKDVFVPELRASNERAFEKWERAGGTGFGLSPEFQMGNEYMWVLLPPASLRLAYHVPDLVVARPRNADGSPESIAVEVEINNKPSDNYERTLRAYRADDRMFKKVIWVCKSIGPARKLEKAAKSTGLWQDGRIEILPIVTENGVYKERDLWFI